MRFPSVLHAFTLFFIASALAMGEDAVLPMQQQSPHPVGVAAPDPATVKQQEALKQKLAERDALQREIDELRRTSQTSEQFIVKVKLMELNRTKLLQAGFDFAELTPEGPVSSSAAAMIAQKCELGFAAVDQGFLAFLDALRQDGIVTVLAEPTLVTVSGRPASFIQGGEITMPPSGEHAQREVEEFGTRVEVLTESLGNNKAKIELKLRQSNVSVPEIWQQGSWIPSSLSQMAYWAMRQLPITVAPLTTSHVTEINTGIEATLGQPLLLGGLRTVKTREVQLDGVVESRKEDFEMLVFISVEAAEAMDPHAAPTNEGLQQTSFEQPMKRCSCAQE